jgi:2'-hydroxyisoflavone reductase
VLVVGGTRFFGLDAVRGLVERGDEVVVLSRRAVPVDLAGRVRSLVASRSDAAALQWLGAEAARGRFDGVLDNVAMDGPDVTRLLDAIGDCGHYLLTSTGSVYPSEVEHRPIAEEDWLPDFPPNRAPLPPEASYGEGKRRAERALLERGSPGRPARWTVLRPTIVFGPGDPSGRLAYYVKGLLAGKPVGPGGFVFNPVFSRDVARLILGLLGSAPAAHRCFNVAGREVVSVGDLCRRIQGILCIPGLGADLQGEPEAPPALPPSGRFVLDLERALQELRFEPTPLRSWLELTAGHIQQGGV